MPSKNRFIRHKEIRALLPITNSNFMDLERIKKNLRNKQLTLIGESLGRIIVQ